MNSGTKFFIVSLLIVVCAQWSSAQNCSQIIGEWQNELGSVLAIDSLTSDGEIKGVYKSSTGVDGKTFNLQGYVNRSDSHPQEVNISFSVRWKGYGSITSWTGYCHIHEGQDQIKTVWQLVRSGKEFDWERIITNSSTFKPIQ
jgi:hypothetical protein